MGVSLSHQALSLIIGYSRNGIGLGFIFWWFQNQKMAGTQWFRDSEWRRDWAVDLRRSPEETLIAPGNCTIEFIGSC